MDGFDEFGAIQPTVVFRWTTEVRDAGGSGEEHYDNEDGQGSFHFGNGGINHGRFGTHGMGVGERVRSNQPPSDALFACQSFSFRMSRPVRGCDCRVWFTLLER